MAVVSLLTIGRDGRDPCRGVQTEQGAAAGYTLVYLTEVAWIAVLISNSLLCSLAVSVHTKQGRLPWLFAAFPRIPRFPFETIQFPQFSLTKNVEIADRGCAPLLLN